VAHWQCKLCKGYTWVEVTGSNPVDSNNILYKQPIAGCHVAAHDWATWHRTTNQILPCVAMSFIHIFQLSTTQLCHVSYGLPRQQSYGLYSQHPFFLPVCHFEQNMISLALDVCLNPNELCWVHNDEAYFLVRFEAILSTLNFEQNLIPWITPPHWKAFGPPKDYFQSI
jgi:hypothetical protein